MFDCIETWDKVMFATIAIKPSKYDFKEFATNTKKNGSYSFDFFHREIVPDITYKEHIVLLLVQI